MKMSPLEVQPAAPAHEAGTPPVMLELVNVWKRFGEAPAQTVAVSNVNLKINKGEFVTLVGPSGCGKSTLFNILTGLLEPDSGSIALDGKPVADLRGRVGYMLQRDLLMPWRTVLDNVIVGLEVRGTPRAESVERAREYLHTFGLL